jgi:hypothetical protein
VLQKFVDLPAVVVFVITAWVLVLIGLFLMQFPWIAVPVHWIGDKAPMVGAAFVAGWHWAVHPLERAVNSVTWPSRFSLAQQVFDPLVFGAIAGAFLRLFPKLRKWVIKQGDAWPGTCFGLLLLLSLATTALTGAEALNLPTWFIAVLWGIVIGIWAVWWDPPPNKPARSPLARPDAFERSQEQPFGGASVTSDEELRRIGMI